MSAYAQPSICIPRVFANIGWKRIKSTIEEAGWGTVAHVDMVMKTSPDGQEYKRVFVHFNEWKDTDVQADLMADKEVTLTYNDPWFWKITKSRAAAGVAAGAPTGKPRSVATGAAPATRSSATDSTVAALEQTVRMQAQQLQLLTSLMLQQSGMAGAVTTPIPVAASATSAAAPAHKKPYKTPVAPMLGDGKYKEKRNYRTPAKRLDFNPSAASAATPTETVATPTTPVAPSVATVAPTAPKKLQLRRKLEDADDAADADATE
jgi:hypothetical protein